MLTNMTARAPAVPPSLSVSVSVRLTVARQLTGEPSPLRRPTQDDMQDGGGSVPFLCPRVRGRNQRPVPHFTQRGQLRLLGSAAVGVDCASPANRR